MKIHEYEILTNVPEFKKRYITFLIMMHKGKPRPAWRSGSILAREFPELTEKTADKIIKYYNQIINKIS